MFTPKLAALLAFPAAPPAEGKQGLDLEETML